VGIIDPNDPGRCIAVADVFRAVGHETIVNIGEQEENAIGSNCGMYASEENRSIHHSGGRASDSLHVPG